MRDERDPCRKWRRKKDAPYVVSRQDLSREAIALSTRLAETRSKKVINRFIVGRGYEKGWSRRGSPTPSKRQR